MNTITMVMTILTLWLVMGLGFVSKYADVRRNGGSAADAWRTNEGLLFIASVLIPVGVLLYRLLSG